MKAGFTQDSGKSSRSGQAAVEYLVVVAAMIAMLAILVVFLGAFREYGGRILQIAASEYP